MEKQLFDDREAWLTEAAALILDDLILPASEKAGYDYERPRYRISVGFPKHTRGGKAVAVCFKRAASSDGVNEIFVNPEIDDPIHVLANLSHELIHACDDCESGHRNYFAKVARSIGLEGKFTATYAGRDLEMGLCAYAELLGKFPHQKMVSDNTHKKGGTRQLKVQCSECDFTFRTSQKWLDHVTDESHCPACSFKGTLEAKS